METQKFLNTQLKIIKVLRKLDSDMGVQTFHAFCAIASEEGIGITELAGRLDMSLAGASRNVQYLSKIRKAGVKGLGLVVSTYDQHERRRKIITLTDKGKDLVEQLMGYGVKP